MQCIAHGPAAVWSSLAPPRLVPRDRERTLSREALCPAQSWQRQGIAVFGGLRGRPGRSVNTVVGVRDVARLEGSAGSCTRAAKQRWAKGREAKREQGRRNARGRSRGEEEQEQEQQSEELAELEELVEECRAQVSTERRPAGTQQRARRCPSSTLCPCPRLPLHRLHHLHHNHILRPLHLTAEDLTRSAPGACFGPRTIRLGREACRWRRLSPES